VKLTTHLHRVSGLRMHGAILPLPQHAFIAWCSVKAQGQLLPLPYAACILALKWRPHIRRYPKHNTIQRHNPEYQEFKVTLNIRVTEGDRLCGGYTISPEIHSPYFFTRYYVKRHRR